MQRICSIGSLSVTNEFSHKPITGSIDDLERILIVSKIIGRGVMLVKNIASSGIEIEYEQIFISY